MTDYRLQFRGTFFPIRGGEVTLGRSSYASIVINNPLASRDHALVRLVDGLLEVVDLGSKNGTFVNGGRVAGTQSVAVGDRIKIGTDVLEVSTMSARDPSALLKVATEPGRAAYDTSRPVEEATETERSAEEDTTALNTRRSVDLAELLVAGCTSDHLRDTTAEAVARILDQFLAEASAGAISGADAGRVREIVRTLGGWSLGARAEEWRKKLEACVAAALKE